MVDLSLGFNALLGLQEDIPAAKRTRSEAMKPKQVPPQRQPAVAAAAPAGKPAAHPNPQAPHPAAATAAAAAGGSRPGQAVRPGQKPSQEVSLARTVFVRGLPVDTDRYQLQRALEVYGPLIACRQAIFADLSSQISLCPSCTSFALRHGTNMATWSGR